jgi:hypothetical protein
MRTMRWWDAENRFELARMWWAENRSRAARIPVSQWENLARHGERALDSEELRRDLKAFLRGDPASAHRGAVRRDWAKTGWAQPGIADSLLEAVETAAVADAASVHGDVQSEYKRCLLSLGKESKTAHELERWRELCQMRDFLRALLLQARALRKNFGPARKEDR